MSIAFLTVPTVLELHCRSSLPFSHSAIRHPIHSITTHKENPHTYLQIASTRVRFITTKSLSPSYTYIVSCLDYHMPPCPFEMMEIFFKIKKKEKTAYTANLPGDGLYKWGSTRHGVEALRLRGNFGYHTDDFQRPHHPPSA